MARKVEFKDFKPKYESELKKLTAGGTQGFYSFYRNLGYSDRDKKLEEKVFNKTFNDFLISKSSFAKRSDRSRPTPLLFSDDVLEIYIVNNKEATIKTDTFKNLNKLKWKTFLKNIDMKIMKNDFLEISVKIISKGTARISFEDNMKNFLNDYNSRFELKFAKADVVSIFRYSPYDMAFVYDGKNEVMMGNEHDFHSGCHGLYEYKGIKLGNYWKGSSDLASRIANGLKKKIVIKEVTDSQYETLGGSIE